MLISLIIMVLCLPLAAWFLLLPFLRRRRWRKVMALPFAGEWRAFLAANVPLYSRLPPELKERLHGLVHVFLDEKKFEGCNNLEVTLAMQLAVAAQACVPMLARRPPLYPGLLTVLVYPAAYMAKQVKPMPGGAWLEERAARSGESWTHGSVVLAWDEIEANMRAPGRNNVVLHEFAHQLDQADGVADGTPPLANARQYESWRRVMARSLKNLRRALEEGRQTLLDPYGSENEAEFFAVATEAFFEMPVDLKQAEPDLYGELEDYFLLDPAAWG